MTGQASPPSGPHDAGKQHILREQIDGAAGLGNDPALAARRNSSAHSLTHRRQRHPARDKPYPPYARSTERALPTSSVAMTIFPPVNVV